MTHICCISDMTAAGMSLAVLMTVAVTGRSVINMTADLTFYPLFKPEHTVGELLVYLLRSLRIIGIGVM